MLFLILGYFLPFYPHNSSKNQNSEKMKKTTGDIIILHMCTKNYDQMMYGSWDMVCDRCNCYFSFWAIFLPFYPPSSPKNQNFKKMKKKESLKVSSFYKCVPIITCVSLDDVQSQEMVHGGQTGGKSDTQRWVPHLKITKNWISQEQKELFRWNKRHFSKLLRTVIWWKNKK